MKKSYFRKKVMGARTMRKLYAFLFLLVSVFLFSNLQKISAQNPVKLKSFQKISDIAGNLGNIIPNDDHFGNGVANIGDLDGDGVPDIAVGSPKYDSTIYGDIGCVYILFMKSDYTVKSYKRITLTPFAIKGGQFGTSVTSMGDLDGDGNVDLAVGANTDGTNPATYPGSPAAQTGAVYIVYLKKSGALKSFAKITSNTTNFLTLPSGSTNTTLFGSAVACPGDIDGDGINDLSVGAPADNAAGSKMGAVYNIFLNKNGTLKSYYKLSNSVSPIKPNLNFGDNFGSSIAGIGDFDGDGVVDIAVGAPHDTSVYKWSGAYYIVYLNSNGSGKSVTKESARLSKVLKRGLIDSANFGVSVAYAPDFNLPHYRTFIVGAHFKNDGGHHRGSIYLVYTDSLGVVQSYQKISDSTAVFNGYLNDDDLFGASVANYGNSDTSSTQTIIGGAPFSDDGQTDAGAIYFLSFKKYDMKVDSIGLPTDTLCANATSKIAIVLENTSNVPLTNFSVGFIAKGSSSSVSITDTIYATLKVREKKLFYLSKSLTLSGSGTFKLSAYVKYFGDINAYNDTFYRKLIILPALSAVNLGKDTNLCSTETYTLDLGNPGAKHLWSTGDTTQKLTITAGVPQGTKYWGQAKSGNCYVSDTIVIGYYKSAKPDLGPAATLCYGDSMQLDAGYPDAKHAWFSSNGFIPDTTQKIWVKNTSTSTKSVTYTAKVTYTRCAYTGTKTINFQHTTVDLGNDVVICEGQSATFNAGNGGGSAKFYWNGDTTSGQKNTYTTSTAGKYYVKVVVSGCSASDTVNLSTVPVPVQGTWTKYDTLCKNETIVLDAGNPGYIHKWYRNGILMGLADTTTKYTVTNYVNKSGDWYKVVISNTSNGTTCSVADSAFVYYTLVTADLGKDTVLCEGTTYTLKAGYTSPTAVYYWNGVKSGQSTYSVTTKGQYIVQITDSKCYATDTVNIDYIHLDPVTLPATTFLCKTDSVVLDAGNTGATKYEWYKNGALIAGAGSQTLVVNSKGNYYAKVYITKGHTTCSVTSTTAAVDKAGIIADLGPDQNVCEGSTVVLNADPKNINKSIPGVSYLWSTGETTPTIQVQGSGIQKYSVEVTQTNGTQTCKADTSVTVTFLPAPEVVLGNDTILCYGDTLRLDAGSGDSTVTYLWNTGATTHNLNVTKKGIYWVIAKNATCQTKKQITVGFYPKLTFELPHKIYLCDSLVNGVTLDPGVADSYLWFPTGETTRKIRAKAPGTYHVEMKNAGGCSIHDSVVVLECPQTEVLIPEIFTPDKDGLNDTFKVYNLNAYEFHMSIYNRWGEQVFNTDDIHKGWDGKFNGQPVTEDVYVYQIIYRLNVSYGTPARKILKGKLMLIRH